MHLSKEVAEHHQSKVLEAALETHASTHDLGWDHKYNCGLDKVDIDGKSHSQQHER